jgi:hypothetical protein
VGVVESEGELFRSGLFDLNDVRQIELEWFKGINNTELLQEQQQALGKIKTSQMPKSIEESKIHENESLPFYAAYRALENRLINLSYVEFGLFVLDGDIGIYEKRPDEKGYLRQLFGRGELNEVGTADSFSNEATPLETTLTRFRYAKADIEQLTPNYRYIPFDSACKEIAAFAGKDENEIKQSLINLANRKHICPYHPYCGFAQPEHEHLWLESAYPEYEVENILRDEFGFSEYDIAFDVEIYLKALKEKGNLPEEEIQKIRKTLDRRVDRHADLVCRQNAIAELMTLQPRFRSVNCEVYKKNSDDLINNLTPLPKIPKIEDRAVRYVWLNILNKRKAVVDASNPSPERTKELRELNKTIDEIERQLGCLRIEQQTDNLRLALQADTPSALEQNKINAELYRQNDIDGEEEIVTRKQIKIIFDKLSDTQWRGNFSREKENGLDNARIGRKGDAKYNLNKVSHWLTLKAYYTKAEIKTSIDKYNGTFQENITTNKPSQKPKSTVAHFASNILNK